MKGVVAISILFLLILPTSFQIVVKADTPTAGGFEIQIPMQVEWVLNIATQKGEFTYGMVPPMELTKDGGIIVAGEYVDYDNKVEDIFLAKYDKNGNREWGVIFGEEQEMESAYCVHQTNDGGYIIVGTANVKSSTYPDSYTEDTDVLLIKTDSAGRLLWSKRIGGGEDEFGQFVLQTSDGGYIIAGGIMYLSGLNAGFSDIYLLRTDQNGNVIWSQVYEEDGYEEGWCVRQIKDDGYIILGQADHGTGGENTDIVLIKTDQNGNLVWKKYYGGEGLEVAYCLLETKDAGFIIFGATSSYGVGGSDLYLVKTDKNGNIEWSRTFGGEKDEIGIAIKETSDGGYLLGGSSFSKYEHEPYWYVIKVDSKGNMEWGEVIENRICIGLLAETEDGGYIIGGPVSVSEKTEIKIIKYVLKTGISGDVLEAGLLRIPPEGGYIKARNKKNDVIYRSRGISNSSLSWDTDGNYRIPCPPGEYQVWAWSPCYIPENKENVIVKEDTITTGLNFRLAPSLVRLDFVVLDTQGMKVEDATIYLKEIGGLFNLTTKTDSNGESWLQLEGTIAPCSANYTVTVSKEQQTSTSMITVAIPYCNNITDPGQVILQPPLVWDTGYTPIKIKAILQAQPTSTTSTTTTTTSITTTTTPTTSTTTSTSSSTTGTQTSTTTPNGGTTLVNTQVTLDNDVPSESYFYSLTEGDRISMSVGVSGDPVNLRIYDSAGDLVFSRMNINSDNNGAGSLLLGKININSDSQYEWTVPYDDIFEFYVETTGVRSMVDITIKATPSTSTTTTTTSSTSTSSTWTTTPPDEDGTLLIVIVAVVVIVVVVIIILLLMRARKSSLPSAVSRQPLSPPPPPPPPPE